jgi:hypothetical protein
VDVSFSILTMKNHINDLLQLGLMSMWYPAEKDTVHVVSRLSGGLTDFGEVF